MLRETTEGAGATLLAIAWIVVTCAFLAAGFFGIRYFLEPRAVALDNRVFHESQAYNDGMVRDLDNMRAEYIAPTTSPEAKAAIRATIIHRFAAYDSARLPADLQNFLTQIRGY